VLDHRRDREKLDPKTLNGFVTGYTAWRKIYRVYVPCLDRIVETCNIYFGPHNPSPGVRLLSEEGKGEEVCVGFQANSDERTDKCAEEKSNESHKQVDDQVITGGENSTESIRGSATSSEPSKPVQQMVTQNQTNARTARGNQHPYIGGEELIRFFNDFREAEMSAAEASDEENSSATLPGEEEEGGTPVLPVRSTSLLIAMQEMAIPRTFAEALSGTNAAIWRKAIREELEAHSENNTWSVVDRPKTGTTLTAKWVFALKRNATGG